MSALRSPAGDAQIMREHLMTERLTRMRRSIAVAATFLVAIPAFADKPITAVPPADYRPRAVEKVAPAAMLLAPGAPAWRVALPEPSAAERASLRARNAATPAAGAKASNLKGPVALAFPRNVPRGSEAIALDQLSWQALADGSHAAKI